jgi:hypothetical protein
VTVTDDTDPSPVLSCSPASGSNFPVGDTTVPCNAHDAAGNDATQQTFIVRVVDTTKPALTLPADVVIVSATPTAVTYTATASDLVGGAITPSCAPVSGSTFPLGPTTVSCSASDAAGNTATGTFKVTVAQDSATGNVGAGGTVSTGSSPSPSDPFETTVTSPNAGAVSIVEQVTTATPPAGFTLLGFEVAITAPPATAASPLVLEFLLDGSLLTSAGVDATTVQVFRNGAVVPACGSGAGTAASPDPCVATRETLAGGDARLVIRTSAASLWNFGAAAGDAVAPVISVPADMTVVRTTAKGAVVAYTVTASDAHDGPVPVNCVPPPGSFFALGATTVTCSATDAAGNTAHAAFTVTVVKKDRTKPEITVPGDITVEATGPYGAIVTYTVTADDEHGHPVVVCSPPSGAAFRLGDTDVRCRAYDEFGNRSEAHFRVRVVDTTAPVFTAAPPDITVMTAKNKVRVLFPAPIAFDAHDAAVKADCNPRSGSTFHAGTTTVECSAEDRQGNRATVTFSIFVVVVSKR